MSEIKKIKVAGSEYGIADEANRAELQNLRNSVNEIKSKALHYGTIHTSTTADEVNIGGKSVDGNNTLSVDIPAATTEKAGVMTAEDKAKIDSGLVGTTQSSQPIRLNTYTLEGVYNLLNVTFVDESPILNSGVVSARLTVLKTQGGDNEVITQVLNLNNNEGGESNVYIRSNQNGTWKPWAKLQTNVEVGQVKTLDNLTDNGIYSGVLTNGTPTAIGTFYDTFVLIVINNYSVASGTGTPHCISQLKYSLALGGGISITKRTFVGGTWSEWSEIGDKYELPEATATTLGGIKLGTEFEHHEGLQLNIGTGLMRYYDAGKKVAKIVIAPADTQNIGGVMLGTNQLTDKIIETSTDLVPVTLDSAAMMCFQVGAGLSGSNSGVLQLKLGTGLTKNEKEVYVALATACGLSYESKDGLSVLLGSGFEFNPEGGVELVKRNYFRQVDAFLPLSVRSNDGLISGGEMGIGLDENTFAEGTDGVLTLKGNSITAEELSSEVRDKVNNPLRPLYISAGAAYNAKTGLYSLNGVDDLTEEQISLSYAFKDVVYRLNVPRVLQNISIRAIFPHRATTQVSQIFKNTPFNGTGSLGSTKMEIFKTVLGINDINSIELDKMLPCEQNSIWAATFYRCAKLREIWPINTGTVTRMADDTFLNCSSLAELRLYSLTCNLPIQYSPLLSKNSVLYIIKYATPASAITITLHHDAYVRLTADQEVLDTLTAKNENLIAEGKGGKISLVCATHSEEITPNA